MLASLVELRLDPRGRRVMNPTSTGDTPPRYPLSRAACRALCRRRVGALAQSSVFVQTWSVTAHFIRRLSNHAFLSYDKTGRTLGGYTNRQTHAFSHRRDADARTGSQHATRDMTVDAEAAPLLVRDAGSPSRERRGGMPLAILASVVGLVRRPSTSVTRGRAVERVRPDIPR